MKLILPSCVPTLRPRPLLKTTLTPRTTELHPLHLFINNITINRYTGRHHPPFPEALEEDHGDQDRAEEQPMRDC